MAFSDTVYSGPMLEGLNRAKLAYMDQDTQRLRDEQTLRAALARVEAMNRQTDAGERNSQMEWGTRGRLGDNQNLIAASDAANRMELGRMGDSTARFGIEEATKRANSEASMRQALAWQAAMNQSLQTAAEGKNALDVVKQQGQNNKDLAAASPYGGNWKGLSEIAAMAQEAKVKNDYNRSISDQVNQITSEPDGNWLGRTGALTHPWTTKQEADQATVMKFLKDFPGSFTWDGKKAVPNIVQSPFPGIVPSQPTPQPAADPYTEYVRQYGPQPLAPGAVWGPNYMVDANGMLRRVQR